MILAQYIKWNRGQVPREMDYKTGHVLGGMYDSPILMRDNRSNDFVPVDHERALEAILNNEDLYARDPHNDDFIKKIDPKEFKKGGRFSDVLYKQNGQSNEKCQKPSPPPNGYWECEEDERECFLNCDEVFSLSRSVVIR